MSENKQPFLVRLAESTFVALTPVVGLVCGFAIVVGLWKIQDVQKRRMVERFEQKGSSIYGEAVGRVAMIETWSDDPPVVEMDGITWTIFNTERCRITFADGRSKTLVGLPRRSIPKDRDIKILWSQFDIYLGWDEVDQEARK